MFKLNFSRCMISLHPCFYMGALHLGEGGKGFVREERFRQTRVNGKGFSGGVMGGEERGNHGVRKSGNLTIREKGGLISEFF